MNERLPATQRLWVEENGSIYVAEADPMIIDLTKKTIMVRQSILLNVGTELARHIVKTHNGDLLYRMLGIRNMDNLSPM